VGQVWWNKGNTKSNILICISHFIIEKGCNTIFLQSFNKFFNYYLIIELHHHLINLGNLTLLLSMHTWYPNCGVHCAASASSMELKTHPHHQWPQQRPERRQQSCPEAVTRTMLLTPQRQGFDFRPSKVPCPVCSAPFQCPIPLFHPVPISSTFTPRIMGRRAHPLSTCPALDWHFCWVRLIAAPRVGGNQVECPMSSAICGCTFARCHNSPYLWAWWA